jgi:dTDP-4-amino-4,6-dideoxygalactose transaminase
MFKQKLVSLCHPVLDGSEKRMIEEVIDSGWLSMGEKVAAFEELFAEMHRMDQAVAVGSCTAGLHLCLAATGIGPGDEVLVPSLTFVATVNAVLYVGAKPVFVDIEDMALPHLSARDAVAKCTEKTKAVIIMHYGGYLMNLPLWRSFADQRGLVLIEDAAHAPGVGEVGRWGDASAFSFFANKNMTTAEGGMILAHDPSVLERIRQMRSHGMTMGTLDRHRGHAYSYDVTMLGYNYRMDELRAAMGLTQLKKLPLRNARRWILSDYYRGKLRTIPEIVVPFAEDHETSAHIMPILLPERVERELVMKSLREAGIQTSIHYPPVHQFSYYRQHASGVTLPITEAFSAREITLPLYPDLSEKDIDRVVNALRLALDDQSGHLMSSGSDFQWMPKAS